MISPKTPPGTHVVYRPQGTNPIEDLIADAVYVTAEYPVEGRDRLGTPMPGVRLVGKRRCYALFEFEVAALPRVLIEILERAPSPVRESEHVS